VTQPYASPADDGGEQGSHTRPQDVLAQPNPADPSDRGAATSFWSSKKGAHRSPLRKFQGALMTLVIALVFASIPVVAAYCNAPQ
jgi:hypothetical protein